MLAAGARLRFQAMYAAQFAFLGVQLPFLSALLDRAGVSPQGIGASTAAALAARLALGPPLAAWADAAGRGRETQCALGAAVAAGAALAAFGAGPAPAILGAVVALYAFGVVIPMTDAGAIAEEAAGRLRYGRARAVGSASFIVANLAGGAFIARYGLGAAGAWLILAGGAMAAAALCLPHTDRAASRPPGAARVLLRDPRFLLLVGAAGAVQASHATYYAFSILHWSAIGYSPLVVGCLWATGVVAEIVLFTTGGRLVAALGPARLIALAGGAAMLRWTATGAEPPLTLLFCLQTLHAATFGAAHLGSVEAAGRIAPHSRAAAMTVVSTFGVGASTGLATLAAGALFDPDAPQAAYLICAGLGFVGAVLALVLRQLTKGRLSPTAPYAEDA